MTTGTKRNFDLYGMTYGTRRAVLATTLGWLTATGALGCGNSEPAATPGISGGGQGGAAGATNAGAGGQSGATTSTSGAGGTGGASGGSTAAGAAGLGGTGGAGGAGGTAGAGGTGGAGGGAAGTAGAGPCSPGRALSLSGNTEGADPAAARAEIDFGSDPELPVGNTSRTIEYWAFVPSSNWVGNKNTMFFYGTKLPRPACGFGLDFGTMKGTLDPFTNDGFDGDNAQINLPFNTDQWVHFAMTWDGTAVNLFVNGVMKKRVTGNGAATMLKTSPSTPTSPLVIGGYPDEEAYFSGAIDEFRVWNVARSEAEITATMKKPLVGNETGLTAYYRFDETSGTTIADSVAPPRKPHTGTLKSADAAKAPTFIVSTAPICP